MDEEFVEWTPFRPFTRESLFNIERRIAEEEAAKVSQPFTFMIAAYCSWCCISLDVIISLVYARV